MLHFRQKNLCVNNINADFLSSWHVAAAMGGRISPRHLTCPPPHVIDSAFFALLIKESDSLY